jgi:hypothetical protein
MDSLNLLYQVGPYQKEQYLNSGYGMFFHCNEDFIDKRFEKISSYINDSKWQRVSDLLSLNKLLSKSVKNKEIKRINLFLVGKNEWMGIRFRILYFLIIKYFKVKNIVTNSKKKLIILGSPNKLEVFLNKLKFYSFLKKHSFEKHIIRYKSFNIIENKLTLKKLSLQFPLLLRKSTSAGGKDTYIINNENELNSLIFQNQLFFVQRKFRSSKWFLVELIDTKLISDYFISFRVLALNNKAYFVYPNISRINTITHVSEKDKLTKKEFMIAVDKTIDIFRLNRQLFNNIFEELDYPFTALDFLIDDNHNLYFTEAEIKMGPSEKYIHNQIDYFDLDENFFSDFRSSISTKAIKYDQFFENLHKEYFE